MKSLTRNIFSVTVFSLIIIFAGYFILKALQSDHYFSEGVILASLFSLINIVALFIFHRGQSREPQNQTMHTLVSLSAKFLLELLLIIIWFILAKKTTSESVLMFFVLYLAFSLFLVLNILKTLKNKSL